MTQSFGDVHTNVSIKWSWRWPKVLRTSILMLVLSEAGGDPRFRGHPSHASGSMTVDPWGSVSCGNGHWRSNQGIAVSQAGVTDSTWFLPWCFVPAKGSPCNTNAAPNRTYLESSFKSFPVSKLLLENEVFVELELELQLALCRITGIVS